MGLMRRIQSDIEGLRVTGVLDQVVSAADCADIECTLLRVQLLTGSWGEAADTARRFSAGAHEDPRCISFGETVGGILAALSSASDTALGSLLPTLHQLSAATESGHRIVVEAAVAFCMSEQDQGPESVELLMRTQSVLERTLPMNYFTWVAEVLASLTMAGLDIPHEGASRLQAMAEKARSGNRPVLEMNSLAMALRLGKADSAARLMELATELRGPVGEAFERMARGALESDPGLVADALERLVGLGQLVYATEPGNELLAMLGHKEKRRIIGLMTRSRHDGNFTDAGDGDGNEKEEPSWVRELTNREGQIARQVIAGMSNAAIARKRGVSVRTVEGHLYQVYSKLQVRNRQELAELDRTWRPAVLAR